MQVKLHSSGFCGLLFESASLRGAIPKEQIERETARETDGDQLDNVDEEEAAVEVLVRGIQQPILREVDYSWGIIVSRWGHVRRRYAPVTRDVTPHSCPKCPNPKLE